MTKTEARQIARQARRYGHYCDLGYPRNVHLSCPQCGQRVTATRDLRQATSGPLYESAGNALDRAMIIHLTDGWCEP